MFDNDDVKSSKSHAGFLSIIFLLKCISNLILIISKYAFAKTGKDELDVKWTDQKQQMIGALWTDD